MKNRDAPGGKPKAGSKEGSAQAIYEHGESVPRPKVAG